MEHTRLDFRDVSSDRKAKNMRSVVSLWRSARWDCACVPFSPRNSTLLIVRANASNWSNAPAGALMTVGMSTACFVHAIVEVRIAAKTAVVDRPSRRLAGSCAAFAKPGESEDEVHMFLFDVVLTYSGVGEVHGGASNPRESLSCLGESFGVSGGRLFRQGPSGHSQGRWLVGGRLHGAMPVRVGRPGVRRCQGVGPRVQIGKQEAVPHAGDNSSPSLVMHLGGPRPRDVLIALAENRRSDRPGACALF